MGLIMYRTLYKSLPLSLLSAVITGTYYHVFPCVLLLNLLLAHIGLSVLN